MNLKINWYLKRFITEKRINFKYNYLNKEKMRLFQDFSNKQMDL